MVHTHAHARFDEAVQLTLSLQIRNITIGNKRPNAYEKSWPYWAQLSRRNKVQDAFDEIRDLMVPDGEFIDLFKRAEIESSNTARHLLRKLDPISSNGSGVLPYEVDREHIFPISVASKLINRRTITKNAREWIEAMGYDIPSMVVQRDTLGLKLKSYCNMLGNQALLNLSKNRKGKDKQFSVKKEYYNDQVLELTKRLGDLTEGDVTRIEERQCEMAERAPSIWRK